MILLCTICMIICGCTSTNKTEWKSPNIKENSYNKPEYTVYLKGTQKYQSQINSFNIKYNAALLKVQKNSNKSVVGLTLSHFAIIDNCYVFSDNYGKTKPSGMMASCSGWYVNGFSGKAEYRKLSGWFKVSNLKKQELEQLID